MKKVNEIISGLILVIVLLISSGSQSEVAGV